MTVNEGFYVYVRSGSRRGLALGPYASEPQARENVDLARRLAERVDAWAGFYQFGTCKVTTSRPLPTGRLNHLALDPPAPPPPGLVDSYRHQHPTPDDIDTGHDRGHAASTARGPVPVSDPLYLIVLDGIVYEGYRDGRPFTLVDAMREVYGTRGVTICRLDPGDVLVPVVTNAGSSSEVVHAPTGRRIRRRPARYTRPQRPLDPSAQPAQQTTLPRPPPPSRPRPGSPRRGG